MRATAWLSLLREDIEFVASSLIRKRAVGRLGQPDQDLEVGVRQPGVLLHLPLDALEEEAVRGEEAAPRPLLLVVEPAGVVHVTHPQEIVELSSR